MFLIELNLILTNIAVTNNTQNYALFTITALDLKIFFNFFFTYRKVFQYKMFLMKVLFIVRSRFDQMLVAPGQICCFHLSFLYTVQNKMCIFLSLLNISHSTVIYIRCYISLFIIIYCSYRLFLKQRILLTEIIFHRSKKNENLTSICGYYRLLTTNWSQGNSRWP